MKLNKDFLNKLKYSNLKKDFNEVIKGISFKEIIVFLAFPIFILLIMSLPSIFRESLLFEIYDPSWWQFITHAFIHENFNHLCHNLQGYFIFGFVLFVFANRIKEKKNLFLLFLFTLLSLPIISSIIEILIYPIFLNNIRTSQGSSGLVSAMVGFLPVLWIYYFSKKQKTKLINIDFFTVSILYVVFLFGIIYYQIHKNFLSILLVLLLMILFCFRYRKNFKLVFKGISEESKDNVIFYFLLVLLPVLFMVAPLLLFPTEIIQEDSMMVDFLMHFIGLLYGIVVSFIFFIFISSKN